MKALAVDTSESVFCVAAKNESRFCSLCMDAGMKQSEKLLPAIDFVLKEAECEASELDYAVLTEGPGSFTGLRLGFSALKGISAAFGTPVYAANTLDFFAEPFLDFPAIVLSVLFARSEIFFAKAFFGGKEILECREYSAKEIANFLENFLEKNCDQKACEKKGFVLVAGNADRFLDACEKSGFLKNKLVLKKSKEKDVSSLFFLAEKKIASKKAPLSDFEAPNYFRKSEAERKNALARGEERAGN